MADEKYTLTDALCDIAVGGAEDDTLKVERASEWVGHHVAELEAQAALATAIVRVAVTEVRPGDTLVFTLREDLRLSHEQYAEFSRSITDQIRARFGQDMQVMVVEGMDVSVLRTRHQVICPSIYTGPQGELHCDRTESHYGDHSASIPNGVVGWNDSQSNMFREWTE